MTTTNIDGRYILSPEGGSWIYARIRNGKVVSQTEESCLSSHVAANDRLSWLGELDFDSLPEVTADEGHAEIVRVVMPGSLPELVYVQRIAE